MKPRILISGGAGFIGHHLVEEILHATDWDIVLIDRLDCSGNLNRLADIGAAKNPRVRFVFHDLRAEGSVQLLRQLGRVDYIVHLAAATHVDRSIDYPMGFVLDNVVGTCNMLEIARALCVAKFIQFSTDEVFGPAPPGIEYREDDRYRSGNPYAATKAGAEELAMSYHNTYGLPVIVTHTMNVIGERQHPEKFVPSTISKVESERVVTIHANQDLSQSGSRFYIYAKDVARMVLALLRKGRVGEKYNLVGEREISNLDLAQMIAKAVGKPLNYDMVDFHSSRPGHDLRYALNGDKMRELYSLPLVDAQQAIEFIVRWSLANDLWLEAA